MSEAAPACPVRTLSATQLMAWHTCSLDIAECGRLEITISLYEHEEAGLRIDTWPAAVQLQAFKAVDDFIAAHPRAQIVAVTSAATRERVTLILHHKTKEG